jgi:tyrosyl-tRNA synthetase
MLPADMYGKVMSIGDEQVAPYFECATRVPLEESMEILKGHPKDAKMRLAREIVALYHGAAAATKAEEVFVNTFTEGGVPTDAPTVRSGKLRDIVTGVSTSELRRLVGQGAISSVLSGKKVESIEAEIKNDTLRIGKHRFLRVE